MSWGKVYFSNFFLLPVLFLCSPFGSANAQDNKYLFRKLGSQETNLTFRNMITDSVSSSAGTYIYIANASGTGVADLNGDGKPDVFFSSNMGQYKLYLNEGDFKFKDVTAEAGIGGNGKWATGVSVADINGDGLLDIYVSHSGNSNEPMDLRNEAFICTGVDVKGIPHYEDKAHELGLDLPGTQTSQVVFFDYDRDGDLDCFVLNHSRNAHGERLITADYKEDTSATFIGYNLLLKNEMAGGIQHFTDVSKKAGIVNSRYNFGLGVVVTDFNNDGWPDIYCTSDFAERDFLYINNHDGTFTENCERSLKHISDYSMGTDAADFNNDLRPDLVTVDMLPDDNLHLKMEQQPDNNDQFDMMVKMGLQYQYRKNCLQLNLGNRDGMPMFADVAEMTGVNATGWSWTPLFIDVNNDGWKDLFISDGYYKDYTNQDKQNKFITNKENLMYGPKKLPSCLFINNKTFGFTNLESWKEFDPAMSYSACAADFDGDGNLDILINNLNSEVTMLRNTSGPATGNFINIKLKENDKNTFAIGAKVYVKCNGLEQMQEMEPIRGYESSQDYMLHFGLGNTSETVKIRVVWPDGKQTEQTASPHSTVTIIKNDGAASGTLAKDRSSKYCFHSAAKFCDEAVGHVENKFNDFKFQFTIPYKQSQSGPAVAEGDINEDGLTDYYIGGSTGNARYFLLGQKDGSVKKYVPGAIAADSVYEDVAAVLFDIDGDGHKDLVVVSGGVEHGQNPEFLADRVYKNDGKGNFVKVPDVFPKNNVSKGCVAAGDFDGDGKPDLFIGGYTLPGKFVQVPRSFLFKNESDKGKIRFADVSTTALPDSGRLGMVTSASWLNTSDKKHPELAVAGEWMPCRILKNQNGVFRDEEGITGLSDKKGMYELLYPTDYDGDGKTDLIVGNIGNNNHFKANADQPLKIFDIKDSANAALRGFLFSYWIKGMEVFASSRGELLQQFVQFRKYFPDFTSYGTVDVKQFFQKINLPMPAPSKLCNHLLSGVFLNKGNGKYEFSEFPDLLQTSRINTIAQLDWNFDGKKDYVVAGNYLGNKHQFGAADALMPYILENQGGGKYRVVQPEESGLFVDGQVKQIYVQQKGNKCRLLFVRNNDKIQVYDNSKN